MNTLHVQLFGTVHIALPYLSSALTLQRANQLLFAYLLLEPRQMFTREHLIGMFWSERTEAHARQCLRSALWRLRHLLEPGGAELGSYLVIAPSGEIGFNWECDYWLDVEEFRAGVEPILQRPVNTLSAEEIGVSERALGLYQGELLEEFYDDWTLGKREQLREIYLSGLAQLMHYYAHHEEFVTSLTYGRRILEMDPLREQTHRAMMRLYAASGQRPLAIRQYEECRRILQQELGVPPMVETESLYRQITTVSGRHHQSKRSDPELATYELVLYELRQAMQHMDEAQSQLQNVTELVKSLIMGGNDDEAV